MMKESELAFNVAATELDFWMTSRVPIRDALSPADLSFPQLNDLLLWVCFPEMAADLERGLRPGEEGFSQVYTLSRLDPFRSFGVGAFERLVETRVQRLGLAGNVAPPPDDMLQSLCWVAFSLERWGQAVLRRPPGVTVNGISLGGTDQVSLHSYLTHHLGNYNTLHRFAIRSVPVSPPLATVDQAGRVAASDFAYINRTAQAVNSSRFPSLLYVDPFLNAIKAGEVLATQYNRLLLQLMERMGEVGLAEREMLDLITDVVNLVTESRERLLGFLADSGFSQQKFIYLLRQMTVEIYASPASYILDHLSLDSIEHMSAKGFLNHYLQPLGADKRAPRLFIWDMLKSAGSEPLPLAVCLRESSIDFRARCQNAVYSLPDSSCGLQERAILKNVIDEVLGDATAGMHRLHWVLGHLSRILPRRSSAILNLSRDQGACERIVRALSNSQYRVAPSGANSLAFFVGDRLLGVTETVLNYFTHIYGRLAVMSGSDVALFWQLTGMSSPCLLSAIAQEVSAGVGGNMTSRSSRVSELKELVDRRDPRTEVYRPYFDFISAFSDLSRAHTACVSKFLRQASKSIKPGIKEKLVSRPEHGTTYMQTRGAEFFDSKFVELPSLDGLDSRRSSCRLRPSTK